MVVTFAILALIAGILASLPLLEVSR